jgi:hypothetical protein
MPRKKNEQGIGGGNPAPAIHVKLDDSQARKLQGELDKQRERLIHLRDTLDNSKHLLHEAQRAFDSAESRHLAGRADAHSLEVARNALDEARKHHAKASIECDEAERLVSDILPAAILDAKNAALAQLRDTLRAETQAKAKQFAALLAQAKGISDELRQLSNSADTYFTVSEMIRLQVSLIGCMDLGEEYGYVSPRAGIPNLACGWLTGRSLEQPTLYDVWTRELEAYLEHSPAEMAEADKLNRVTHIAQDARRYKECLVREEAQRKLEAMLEARAGGKMPAGTKLLD